MSKRRKLTQSIKLPDEDTILRVLRPDLLSSGEIVGVPLNGIPSPPEPGEQLTYDHMCWVQPLGREARPIAFLTARNPRTGVLKLRHVTKKELEFLYPKDQGKPDKNAWKTLDNGVEVPIYHQDLFNTQ